MEIERKWLLKEENIPFDLKKAEKLEIEQAYISFSPTIRIRKIANKREYYLTIKSKGIEKGLAREEYEIPISKKEYDNLLIKSDSIVLSKTRYKVKEGKYTYEIDFFHKGYDGLIYIEIEFKTLSEAKKFKVPIWFGKELTGDKRFTNAGLAKELRKVK